MKVDTVSGFFYRLGGGCLPVPIILFVFFVLAWWCRAGPWSLASLYTGILPPACCTPIIFSFISPSFPPPLSLLYPIARPTPFPSSAAPPPATSSSISPSLTATHTPTLFQLYLHSFQGSLFITVGSKGRSLSPSQSSFQDFAPLNRQ